MEFNATYLSFGEWVDTILVPPYEVVPIRLRNPAEVLRDPSRRPTLRMQWRVCVDAAGRVYLRATWDARRHIRSMDDQRLTNCGGWRG
jgi:hypothetical protein